MGHLEYAYTDNINYPYGTCIPKCVYEENYLNPLEELPGHHEIIHNIMYLSK